MSLEKKANITLLEYLIIKNSPNISFLKTIFIALVFYNCEFNNRGNASLVSLFFKKLSSIYQIKKAELAIYFEAISILESIEAIRENDYKLTVIKELTLVYTLTENQINIIHELNKISDNVFYGMVIENV